MPRPPALPRLPPRPQMNIKCPDVDFLTIHVYPDNWNIPFTEFHVSPSKQRRTLSGAGRAAYRRHNKGWRPAHAPPVFIRLLCAPAQWVIDNFVADRAKLAHAYGALPCSAR
jgi:hypothetical protein